MPLVYVEKFTQIDIVSTAITGRHNALLAEPGLETFGAAAYWRIEAAWDPIELRIVDRASMLSNCTSTESGRHGVIVSRIVGRTGLDDIALKTQHQVELAVILELHDVPKYRPLADPGHLLRPSLGVLNQTATELPCKSGYLHLRAAMTASLSLPSGVSTSSTPVSLILLATGGHPVKRRRYATEVEHDKTDAGQEEGTNPAFSVLQERGTGLGREGGCGTGRSRFRAGRLAALRLAAEGHATSRTKRCRTIAID